VTEAETLIPPAVTARARKRKRIAIAFGRRFFLLIVVGLVWLGPAFYDPRFYFALAGWDFLVLVAWAVDLAAIPAPEHLSVTRRWTDAAALSVPSKIELVVANLSRRAVLVTIIDNIPPQLRREAPALEMKCLGPGEACASYPILPTQRGDIELGAAYIRYRSPMRIAEFISSAAARSSWKSGTPGFEEAVGISRACASIAKAMRCATSVGPPPRGAESWLRACIRSSAARRYGWSLTLAA
jgi:hypothetical protein